MNKIAWPIVSDHAVRLDFLSIISEATRYSITNTNIIAINIGPPSSNAQKPTAQPVVVGVLNDVEEGWRGDNEMH